MFAKNLVLATLTSAAVCLPVLGQADNSKFVRPKYNGILRQNEDWSGLAGRDTHQTGDAFDPIKYIPLSEDGDTWISFGGHVRSRLESWNNLGFSNKNDDTFLLSRVHLHGDLHMGQFLRVYVEGRGAYATRRDLPGGRRTSDADSAALHQGFVDVTLPFTIGDQDATFTIRTGRQSLLFGRQRLVSPLPWANAMRAWDGFSGILKVADWKVTGFWTQFVPTRKFGANKADGQTEFFGIYATGKAPVIPGAGLDLYFLGLDRDAAATPGGGFNGTFGNERRYTYGGRIWGGVGGTPLDYELESAFQTGEVGTADINNAYMIASQIGYKLADFNGAPRVFVGYDFASGDDSPGGDVNTFNQLFPLGHAYFGYMDVIGRQNINDLSTGITFKPMDKLTAKVTGHYFWLADKADALYSAGGGVVRPGGVASSRDVGREIDTILTYKFNTHLTGEVGYTHFFADDFVSQTGSSNDIDFTYVQMLLQF